MYFDRWNLIEEADNRGDVLARYVNRPETDEILSKTGAYDTVYYHCNELGSVTSLTGRSGRTVETYTNDVFGKPFFADSNGPVLSASRYGNRFGFAGREYDPETGLYEIRRRMYSPELGRFLQPDPVGFGGEDYNLYRYVENDPVNYRDPDGTKKTDAKRKPKPKPKPKTSPKPKLVPVPVPVPCPKPASGGGSTPDSGTGGGGSTDGGKGGTVIINNGGTVIIGNGSGNNSNSSTTGSGNASGNGSRNNGGSGSTGGSTGGGDEGGFILDFLLSWLPFLL